MTDLGALGAGTYSSPVGINDRGDVVGVRDAKNGWERVPLERWESGSQTV
jgi:hypothetical protein